MHIEKVKLRATPRARFLPEIHRHAPCEPLERLGTNDLCKQRHQEGDCSVPNET
jgi:hypothetical protein